MTGPRNVGVHRCVWVKEGSMKNAGGLRLEQTIEFVNLFFFSKSGKVKPSHFSFERYFCFIVCRFYSWLLCLLDRNEARPKHFMCHRVYSKALDENRKKISPYQKPAKLFAYLLNHHSRKSEWVLDATGGSGVGNLLLF